MDSAADDRLLSVADVARAAERCRTDRPYLDQGGQAAGGSALARFWRIRQSEVDRMLRALSDAAAEPAAALELAAEGGLGWRSRAIAGELVLAPELARE